MIQQYGGLEPYVDGLGLLLEPIRTNEPIIVKMGHEFNGLVEKREIQEEKIGEREMNFVELESSKQLVYLCSSESKRGCLIELKQC